MNLLTVADVSKMLRLSKSKVYEMVGSGELPSLKISGSSRFLESDLLAYIESCRCDAPPKKQSRPHRTLKHIKL